MALSEASPFSLRVPFSSIRLPPTKPANCSLEQLSLLPLLPKPPVGSACVLASAGLPSAGKGYNKYMLPPTPSSSS